MEIATQRPNSKHLVAAAPESAAPRHGQGNRALSIVRAKDNQPNYGDTDMAGTIDARLKELGLELPQAPKAAGAYVGYVQTGNQLFVAGQIPLWNGELRHIGKVGVEISIEEAQEAARVCALNIVAQTKDALGGDLDRVVRIVKLGGFVNCPPDFTQHPEVINGASNLIGDIFGDKGAHARFAMGAGSLPRNVAVEIDAVIEVA